MKIKITTMTRPWVDGKPRAYSEVVNAPDAEADTMIERGHAEKVGGKKND